MTSTQSPLPAASARWARKIRNFFRPALVAGIALALIPTQGQSAAWLPDAKLGDPAQHLLLYNTGRRCGDDRYDDSVGLTTTKPGKGEHLLRESAYYAYGLLMTGDKADRQRAEKIIRVILTKQDLNKERASYGWFPIRFEDEWETLTKPDPNFCQFVGLALGQIIDLDNRQGHVLPKELRQQLETSFRIAVEATIVEDIDPNYTNICLLSAAMGAAGDKLLNVPGARAFAKKKLQWIVDHNEGGNAVREYLAPTYYGIDLLALYTAKVFAASPDVASLVDRTLDVFWKEIAASYHAPTFQLAGPHSRAYCENMLIYASGLKYFIYLVTNGQYPLPDINDPTATTWDAGFLTIAADLPVALRPEIGHTPTQAWREVCVNEPSLGMGFRQYRDGDFILGSINRQSLWKQQRSVVAYWPVTSPSWHVAFCQDMSAQTLDDGYAHYASVQSKNAVLAAITSPNPMPKKGGLRFGFNSEAQPKEGPGGTCVVRDGEVAVHIYPVTRSEVQMSVHTDNGRIFVERPWSTSDPVGGSNLLSYLLVFQLPGKPEPVVKDLALNTVGGVSTVSATVDGAPLSLEVEIAK